jgi:hypothetical protein
LESAADWRWKKAQGSPDDSRNMAAHDILQRLAQTVDQVSADRMQAYAEAFSKNLECAVETEKELIKAVGFRVSFDTAESFILRVIDLLPETGPAVVRG